MEIPQMLFQALEGQVEGKNQAALVQAANDISARYRAQMGTGKSLLNNDCEATAYAASRMPATYCAVLSALKATFEVTKFNVKTLLDVGAGTGAATWAADNLFELESIVCLEREASMRKIGEAMMSNSTNALKNAKWINQDLNVGELSLSAELVIASYVLNEMAQEAREKTILKLWDTTKKILLLVEPGTPVGFNNLRSARKLLLAQGAHVAAPCTHEKECKITQDDWCHFSCRVARSRLHRTLKGGDAPYEDEKFAYVAFTKEKFDLVDLRILRHPQIHSGYVEIEACSKDEIKKTTLSKKDGAVYKKARKLNIGDSFVL